jgi:aspartate ammonia-lyase
MKTETDKAVENFALDYKPVNRHLIYAVVQVKKAAALVYADILPEKKEIYNAITAACNEVLAGKYDAAFPVDALQGGAGTSTNMNVNEVLAEIANNHTAGAGTKLINPLDDVNRGQSTNDVYPTALRIAAIGLLRELSNSCAALQESLQQKENDYSTVKKLGRTELMDAVPITLGNEFGAYSQAVGRDRWRLYKIEERLRQVNIGGTAVGTATNAERKYRFAVIEKLRELTGIGLAAAEYPLDITQNNDVFVEVSGLLKAAAVNLMKIANDLRLMNSGPRGGFGEIKLQKLQMGSTIMPGKVNPVIPEMVIQVAIRVMSNDYAITTAAAHGEFELNAFTPLIADSLLESLSLLIRATQLFRTKCIETLEVNKERCLATLENSLAFAAEYVPQLGYERVAAIIEKITEENNGEPQAVRKALEENLH